MALLGGLAEEFFIPYVWTLATQVFPHDFPIYFSSKMPGYSQLTFIISADALEWG